MSSWSTAGATEVPEGYTREAILAWYRGEFAAANAIIDVLCQHLAHKAGGSPEYRAVFAAIQRRRMNWIPVIHMQKYFSIADVTAELLRVSARRPAYAPPKDEETSIVSTPEKQVVEVERAGSTAEISPMGESGEDYSVDSKILEDGGASDGGSHTGKISLEDSQISHAREVFGERPDRIKISKGFVSKEQFKGGMINVVKGLKLYKEVFTNSELLRLSEFINKLRLAGQRGDLPGETFISFNKQMKGNKREIIQLGLPLFQQTKEEATSNIEPIPQVLQTVIDQLVQWRLIPGSKKPTSCIINFFDEDEYSQPYFKPPHLDNPISTLLLSDTTIAFGRTLTSDPHGNYKGSFTLPVQEGSLLVMRGNSADVARHVICPSSNKRVSITFIKVRPPNNQTSSASLGGSPVTKRVMTLWQPGGTAAAQKAGYGGSNGAVATWGMSLSGPVIMSPKTIIRKGVAGCHGTGVFLPWSSKKFVRHLPPRIQKKRLPSLPTITV
ncbi:hypothetical protein J5N97_013048 [Dioscorea zingiberensis]|uniref:Fe2OG dioxygenase domain-containing protein n=1 Tax=Dioscorea zingiberensis TaxID=325984 RepID=A0A9D5CR53_9LILI|nr:hypothetical protein J5N97_013048 [Dioscorea zingiberensis]